MELGAAHSGTIQTFDGSTRPGVGDGLSSQGGTRPFGCTAGPSLSPHEDAGQVLEEEVDA